MIPDEKALILTREQLYEQVWATPMGKLAASYGLSNVGLAKICEKHSIPRPPSGYWTKMEFGKAFPPAPLSPCVDASLQTVQLFEEEPTKNASTP